LWSPEGPNAPAVDHLGARPSVKLKKRGRLVTGGERRAQFN